MLNLKSEIIKNIAQKIGEELLKNNGDLNECSEILNNNYYIKELSSLDKEFSNMIDKESSIVLGFKHMNIEFEKNTYKPLIIDVLTEQDECLERILLIDNEYFSDINFSDINYGKLNLIDKFFKKQESLNPNAKAFTYDIKAFNGDKTKEFYFKKQDDTLLITKITSKLINQSFYNSDSQSFTINYNDIYTNKNLKKFISDIPADIKDFSNSRVYFNEDKISLRANASKSSNFKDMQMNTEFSVPLSWLEKKEPNILKYLFDSYSDKDSARVFDKAFDENVIISTEIIDTDREKNAFQYKYTILDKNIIMDKNKLDLEINNIQNEFKNKNYLPQKITGEIDSKNSNVSLLFNATNNTNIKRIVSCFNEILGVNSFSVIEMNAKREPIIQNEKNSDPTFLYFTQQNGNGYVSEFVGEFAETYLNDYVNENKINVIVSQKVDNISKIYAIDNLYISQFGVKIVKKINNNGNPEYYYVKTLTKQDSLSEFMHSSIFEKDSPTFILSWDDVRGSVIKKEVNYTNNFQEENNQDTLIKKLSDITKRDINKEDNISYKEIGNGFKYELFINGVSIGTHSLSKNEITNIKSIGFIESDCIPIQKTFINEIENAYKTNDKQKGKELISKFKKDLDGLLKNLTLFNETLNEMDSLFNDKLSENPEEISLNTEKK